MFETEITFDENYYSIETVIEFKTAPYVTFGPHIGYITTENIELKLNTRILLLKVM
jgi:hypothetical protein